MKQAYDSVDTSHADEVVLTQILQSDLLQKVFLPAFDAAVNTNRHVALLADYAAEAPLLVSGSHMGQGICQVVELAPLEQFWVHVILEPEHLGYFHFY